MENGFNLRERTALIVGAFSTTVQNLVMNLTQLGCDCVLLDVENATSQRFCNQINDAREINSKYGRALNLKNPLKTVDDIKEAVGLAAQSFGAVDLLIDVQVFNKQNRFKIGAPIDYLDEELANNFKSSVYLTHAVLNYFKSRKRGRVLYLMNENYPDPILAATRGALIPLATSLAKQMAEYNITLNVLKLGITEEYAQAEFPDAKTLKEAVEKLREKNPGIKILDSEKVSNTVMYLVSQYGSGITGQIISLS